MRRVEISARLIRWPNNCACCCGPADTSINISFTSRTGVRVIHEQTKSWRVPYCSQCFDHIDAARKLAGFGWVVVHRPSAAVLFALVLVGAAIILLRSMTTFPSIVFGTAWAGLLGFGLYALF